ncbi:MAG TPA: hypothetical protein PKC20_07195 [Burkholderiaceae bacterium]|nr:hypothetical protein [Burkholderiaceae bacterium]
MNDWMGFFSNLLLFLTMTTLTFAVIAYFAFKLRQRRVPARAERVVVADDPSPMLSRYRPDDPQ